MERENIAEEAATIKGKRDKGKQHVSLKLKIKNAHQS